MIKISGLWKAKMKKSGKSYLRGTLSPGVDILIFPNENKKTANHPDYTFCISERAKQPNTKKKPAPVDDLDVDENGEIH